MGIGSRIGSEFGDYRIQSLLGRGGMGMVYLAQDRILGRRVALKVLAPELGENPGFRARFSRESQLAASIDHPNILPVYGAGEQEGEFFIAMRFVDGFDLEALLREQGPLDPDRALRIAGQIGAALDAAIDRGLVHRDVKPANVLVAVGAGPNRTEHCYLTDFGLTRDRSSPLAFSTGQVMGTVDYLAPEQIQGKEVDGRTDQYALACILFQCLTGRVPFEKDEDVAVLFAHLNDEPPRVSDLRPELPPEIDAVIARGMAKRKEDRFPICGDMVAAAAVALRERDEATPKLPVRASRRTRRWIVAALVLVLVSGAAVTIGLASRGSGGDAVPGDVYVMNADGTGVSRLLHFPDGASHPSWSPDGTKIAFVSPHAGSNDVYVMNADGTGVVQLTHTVASESEPVWSPDGSRMAFVSDRARTQDIYVMNADGSHVVPVTSGPATDADPAWSHDGTQIAFASDRRGGSDIWIVNADGTKMHMLVATPAPEFAPLWSPNGSKLAFVSTRGGNQEIYVRFGGSTTRLTYSAGHDLIGSWSPDGSRISFVSDRSGARNIYVMNADGTDVVQLTHDPAGVQVAAWSPDGLKILFVGSRRG